MSEFAVSIFLRKEKRKLIGLKGRDGEGERGRYRKREIQKEGDTERGRYRKREIQKDKEQKERDTERGRYRKTRNRKRAIQKEGDTERQGTERERYRKREIQKDKEQKEGDTERGRYRKTRNRKREIQKDKEQKEGDTERGRYRKREIQKDKEQKEGDTERQGTERGRYRKTRNRKREIQKDKEQKEGDTERQGTERGRYRKREIQKDKEQKEGDTERQGTERGRYRKTRNRKREIQKDKEQKEGDTERPGTKRGRYRKRDIQKDKEQKWGDTERQDERTSLLVSREISSSPSLDDNKELPPAKHERNATYGTLDGDSSHVASRVQECLLAEHEVRLRATTSVDARLETQNDLDARCSLLYRGRSNSDPVERHHLDPSMDAGILRALKTVKSNPYVQYVGLGLAGLVTQKELHDQQTGAPLRKTKMQLIRISAAVCGIELCYAAETAFVSPILLKLGVPPSLMTMVWCLSPILGFFLVPIMGSLSDRCSFKLGRRRPFIIIMSIGIILGLALVPNGEILGIWIGDSGNETINARPHLNSSIEDLIPKRTSLGFSFTLPPDHLWGIIFTILGVAMLDFNCDACQSPCRAYLLDVCVPEDHPTGLTMFTVMAGLGGTVGYIMGGIDWNATSFGEALGGHIRVVFSVVLIAFFVFVTLTLTSFREIPLKDLSIKKSELQKVKKKVGKSKYRKFTNEDTSSSGEEEQTERSDIGRVERVSSYGALCETDKNALRKHNAYLTSHSETDKDKHQIANISGRHWTVSDNLHNDTNLNKDSENQLVKEINYGDSVYPKARSANGASGSTIPEIRSIEVSSLNSPQIYDNATSYAQNKNSSKATSTSRVPPLRSGLNQSYQCNGSLASGERQGNPQHLGSSVGAGVRDVIDTVEVSTDVTLKTYLKSIIRMPKSMWILCLCNLLCWMSLVCYSLYFTDFVGQSVYGGDPMAPVGTDLHDRYDAGVRLGSFAMSLYSFSCACYSLGIERLVQRFRAKKVYVIGQLVFTLGMAGMAVSRSKIAVILLSPAAGIMYATLFTMPYLLVAHYHTRGMFSHGDPSLGDCKQVRGLGTDVAIISSMVFLAQFLLSVLMGTVVTAVDSTVAVIVTSAILSFLGSLTATQVTYLDL